MAHLFLIVGPLPPAVIPRCPPLGPLLVLSAVTRLWSSDISSLGTSRLVGVSPTGSTLPSLRSSSLGLFGSLMSPGFGPLMMRHCWLNVPRLWSSGEHPFLLLESHPLVRLSLVVGCSLRLTTLPLSLTECYQALVLWQTPFLRWSLTHRFDSPLSLANSAASSQVPASHLTPWSSSAVTLGAPRRALYRCLSTSLGSSRCAL